MVSDALLYGSAAGIYYTILVNAGDPANPDPLENVLTRQSAKAETGE